MKWHGVIGYAETVETSPGVWDEKIIEREKSGNIIKNTRMLQNSGQVNDNIKVSNTISIIADPYASQNFHSIRYITFMGTKWKVSNIDVQYPRLILTLGDVYNG